MAGSLNAAIVDRSASSSAVARAEGCDAVVGGARGFLRGFVVAAFVLAVATLLPPISFSASTALCTPITSSTVKSTSSSTASLSFSFSFPLPLLSTPTFLTCVNTLISPPSIPPNPSFFFFSLAPPFLTLAPAFALTLTFPLSLIPASYSSTNPGQPNIRNPLSTHNFSATLGSY